MQQISCAEFLIDIYNWCSKYAAVCFNFNLLNLVSIYEYFYTNFSRQARVLRTLRFFLLLGEQYFVLVIKYKTYVKEFNKVCFENVYIISYFYLLIF